MVNQIISTPQGSAAIHTSDDGTHELAIYRNNKIKLIQLEPTATFEEIKKAALDRLGLEIV